MNTDLIAKDGSTRVPINCGDKSNAIHELTGRFSSIGDIHILTDCLKEIEETKIADIINKEFTNNPVLLRALGISGHLPAVVQTQLLTRFLEKYDKLRKKDWFKQINNFQAPSDILIGLGNYFNNVKKDPTLHNRLPPRKRQHPTPSSVDQIFMAYTYTTKIPGITDDSSMYMFCSELKALNLCGDVYALMHISFKD